MTKELTNGQVLHEGSSYPSPFTHLVALGWYDGPTNGLLRAGDAVWKFDMLDEIHNPNGLDLRIFTLACMPYSAWDQLLSALSKYHTPMEPVWVPRWQFPSDADLQATNQMTDEVLSQGGPVEWVVASECLLTQIEASRAVTPPDLKKVSDWPSFLNLGQRISSKP
jgi:hypothetical protein